ncbi:putative SF4 helicase domain-containing protein [Vibrio virus VPMCC5]|nr:putative SF4 helicase domain-containing protein [Vibrio virus VPMCC5]
MGICLDKISHSCGTRQGLQVFEREDGTVDGYCFSCKTYVRHPYGDECNVDSLPKKRITKSREEIMAEIKEVESYPIVDLADRRLRASDLDAFGIKIGLDETDGVTPRLIYFPYEKDGELSSYKTKLIDPKRFWSLGDQGEVDLFGWSRAISLGSKRLIVVEGEFDAPALTKILEMHVKQEYKDSLPAVCSLPHGAASAGKDLARLAPKIRKHFTDISFCFDKDAAGELATTEACKVFPEATVITLPEKDANDCVIKGKTKAAYNAAIFKADKPKNTRLVSLDDIYEEAKEVPEMGVSMPWSEVTKVMRGARTGETHYVAAGAKMGKSEIVNTLGAHFVCEHGWDALFAKPEEANKKTVKLLAGKVASKRFHDPDVAFDEDAFEEAGKKLKGNKVFMIDLYQHVGWESLKQDITAFAKRNDKKKVVFIDPITNLTNGMATSDANVKLQEISQELAAMAKDLDILIFIFCHLNKPNKGCTPWDRGGRITTDFFAGSSAMERSCNYMWGLEGNKDPDLPEEERNMRDLVLLADREYGETLRCRLFWDKHTTQFNEVGSR